MSMPNNIPPKNSAVSQENIPQTVLAENQPQNIQPPQPNPKPSIARGVIIIFAILYVALNVGIYLYGTGGLITKLVQFSAVKKQGKLFQPTPTPTLTPTPTPTPIQLFPDDGLKGTFNVTQGKHAGPIESHIIFDPFDVKKGQPLTITVKLSDTVPISTVAGILQTDHGSQNAVFTRINGTDLAGEWQTTIHLQDSVLYTYIMKITATSANGTGIATTAPRSQ